MRTVVFIPVVFALAASPALALEAPTSSTNPPIIEQLASNDHQTPQAVIGYQSPHNTSAPIVMPNRVAQGMPSQPGDGLSPMMNDLRWLNF